MPPDSGVVPFEGGHAPAGHRPHAGSLGAYLAPASCWSLYVRGCLAALRASQAR